MSLRRHIFSYSAANMVNAALPFLLLPLLTSYLSPGDYGKLSLVQLMTSLSFPFILLNIHSLFVLEYSKLSPAEFGRFVSSMVWIPLGAFALLELLFILFHSPLSAAFKIPSEWVLCVPLFALMQSIPTMLPVIFQAKKEPLNYAKFKISLTLANFAFTLVFIVSLGMGWEGRILGIAAAYALFSLIGLAVLRSLGYLELYVSRDTLKEALRFGIPLLPHTLAGILLAMSDKLFLANMMGVHEVGLYSVAFQVAGGILIVMTSVNQAWMPHLYEQLNASPSAGTKILIVGQTYKVALAMAAFTLVFIALVPLVYRFFIGENYQGGVVLSQVLSVAFLLQGFYFIVTNYIFYVKKTYLLSIVTTLSLLLLWGLNYFFILRYGVIGSAYALVCGYGTIFILGWILAHRLYPMPWIFWRNHERHI